MRRSPFPFPLVLLSILFFGIIIAALIFGYKKIQAQTPPSNERTPAPLPLRAFAYVPQQPIAFSHKLHAGDLAIPCQYCHIYADRSPVAGVPPVAWCMNCHKVVGAQRPGVEKLKEYWQNQKPIEWTKVFDTPDFVYFSHRAHLAIAEDLRKAGRPSFTCQTCHGPIETMEVVGILKEDTELEAVPLTMGWCLNCHKARAQDVAYVMKLKSEAYKRKVRWETLIGEVDVTPTDTRHTLARLRDCLTCHK